MKHLSTYRLFESTRLERQIYEPHLDVLFERNTNSRENAEGIRSDIIDIFYDLEDLDFSIYVQLNAITLYEWTYQVRIGKKDDTSFSFDEVQETIERFIDYINPYVVVSSSFPGRNPIDFQIEHYRWSLQDRLKYNLSYDDMKKVMDKDDNASAVYHEDHPVRHVTPKLGDNLRTIYIDVKVRLKANESNNWDSGHTCSIFDLPKEMRDDISDVLLELEDDDYVVTFIPKADVDNCPFVHILEPVSKVGGFNLEDIKDVVDRIDTIARDYGWRIDTWNQIENVGACSITFIK